MISLLSAVILMAISPQSASYFFQDTSDAEKRSMAFDPDNEASLILEIDRSKLELESSMQTESFNSPLLNSKKLLVVQRKIIDYKHALEKYRLYSKHAKSTSFYAQEYTISQIRECLQNHTFYTELPSSYYLYQYCLYLISAECSAYWKILLMERLGLEWEESDQDLELDRKLGYPDSQSRKNLLQSPIDEGFKIFITHFNDSSLALMLQKAQLSREKKVAFIQFQEKVSAATRELCRLAADQSSNGIKNNFYEVLLLSLEESTLYEYIHLLLTARESSMEPEAMELLVILEKKLIVLFSKPETSSPTIFLEAQIKMIEYERSLLSI